jgi:RNA polymerase primary sigma factor
MLEDYLKTIRKYDPLTKDEERELFKKYKNGDNSAKDKIICANLRFVVQFAKANQIGSIALEDLIFSPFSFLNEG